MLVYFGLIQQLVLYTIFFSVYSNYFGILQSWKVKKAFKMSIQWRGFIPSIQVSQASKIVPTATLALQQNLLALYFCMIMLRSRHVHMTFLKIDMRNPVLVCGPMKFLLIKPCEA